jgi:xanthine dehydrogenase YagT iron-sulfur-binding subunit
LRVLHALRLITGAHVKPISRRSFIQSTGAGVAGTAALPSLRLEGAQSQPDESAAEGAPRTSVELKVNGKSHRLDVEDRWTLVEVLRDHLGLTGTRVGCDRGECGSCTVLLNGSPIYSCSYLAVWAAGAEITTVEGLADGQRLDVLQQAFIEHDGPQCGFCTSGQLMAARSLLDHCPDPSPEQVRQAMAGVLCRCSNYNHYVESVLAAAKGPPTRG